MKSILYVGATLMIGASIYGFVDYKNTSHKKEFKEMYVEEKAKEPAVTIAEDKKEPAVKNEVVVKTRKAVSQKKAIREEETIVPVKPIADDEKMLPGETKNIEVATVTVTPSKDDLAKKTIKKKKKISSRLFSRAPLREEMDELPQPVKTEPKKNKE